MWTASAACLTLEIALSAICSANSVRRFTTDMPNGDGDLRSPGDAERAQVIIDRRKNAELGTLCDLVT